MIKYQNMTLNAFYMSKIEAHDSKHVLQFQSAHTNKFGWFVDFHKPILHSYEDFTANVAESSAI